MIRTEQDLTPAVLAELNRAQDPRFKVIMGLAIKHLHAFVREAQLTEQEFYAACGTIAKLGQATTPSHNEVVLMAGSLGVSALVCLLNNQLDGQATTANLLGPFWRMDSPATANGASIVRSSTVGVPLFMKITVKDTQGLPVAGASVDVWNTSAEGFYENQDPAQANMNLRGQFTTDEHGCIWFDTIKPSGYPVPVNSVVGDWLRAQGRHNMRPAHVHFLIAKDGYKTQFSQVYDGADANLETDSQFGVTEPLVAHFIKHTDEAAPNGDVLHEWYSVAHSLTILPGLSCLPRAPITGKSDAPRPERIVLQRSA
jgi:protocatechuate 3,4-dioxygenase beta subunit